MGFFGAAHGWGGGQKAPPPPKKLSHIHYNDETWHSYNLPKEDPKIYESRDTPLEFSNYIMDVVMSPKFGNSSICIREIIITSIL